MTFPSILSIKSDDGIRSPEQSSNLLNIVLPIRTTLISDAFILTESTDFTEEPTDQWILD
jgi:hypothetical protein